MRARGPVHAGLLILLATLAGGCGRSATAPVGSEVGNRAADFSLTDAAGRPVRLAELEGKVVVLDFWATWCPPCKKEIPGFVDLQTRYKDRDVVVVGVSLDESWEPVRPFAAAYRINYPVVLGTPELVRQYRISEGIPTTFVIGRDGVIRSRHLGYAPPEVFAKAVDAAL